MEISPKLCLTFSCSLFPYCFLPAWFPVGALDRCPHCVGDNDFRAHGRMQRWSHLLTLFPGPTAHLAQQTSIFQLSRLWETTGWKSKKSLFLKLFLKRSLSHVDRTSLYSSAVNKKEVASLMVLKTANGDINLLFDGFFFFQRKVNIYLFVYLKVHNLFPSILVLQELWKLFVVLWQNLSWTDMRISIYIYIF